jgi:hypothetical protein
MADKTQTVTMKWMQSQGNSQTPKIRPKITTTQHPMMGNSATVVETPMSINDPLKEQMLMRIGQCKGSMDQLPKWGLMMTVVTIYP